MKKYRSKLRKIIIVNLTLAIFPEDFISSVLSRNKENIVILQYLSCFYLTEMQSKSTFGIIIELVLRIINHFHEASRCLDDDDDDDGRVELLDLR